MSELLPQRLMHPRRRPSRVVTALLVCGLVSLNLAACSTSERAPNQPPPPGEAWQARPVSIRVYPSTRFSEERGDVLLEANIELLDEMGDPVKGAGEFRLELYEAEGRARGRQLYLWRIPVYTIEEQRRFYDGITRSYLLRLRLDAPEVARQPAVLRASFAPLASARLEAEATLKPMPQPPAPTTEPAAE